MASLGLHFALTSEELQALRDVPANEQGDYIGEVLEAEKFDTPDACETDKSWAYIHGGLNGTDPDGPLVVGEESENDTKIGLFARFFGAKSPPAVGDAKYAIMGHTHILSADDYYIGLIEADRVASIAASLDTLTSEDVGQRVRDSHRKFHASGDVDDAVEYAMGWYPGLVEFYRHAAATGKNVIFTVDF